MKMKLFQSYVRGAENTKPARQETPYEMTFIIPFWNASILACIGPVAPPTGHSLCKDLRNVSLNPEADAATLIRESG